MSPDVRSSIDNNPSLGNKPRKDLDLALRPLAEIQEGDADGIVLRWDVQYARPGLNSDAGRGCRTRLHRRFSLANGGGQAIAAAALRVINKR